MVRYTAQGLQLIRKHLELWDDYVDLICDVASTDLIETILKLIRNFDWQEDVTEVSCVADCTLFLNCTVFRKVYLNEVHIYHDPETKINLTKAPHHNPPHYYSFKVYMSNRHNG